MIGDCGYIDVVPVIPYMKPECRDLTATELLFDREANRRRWVVEQGIAHFRSF